MTADVGTAYINTDERDFLSQDYMEIKKLSIREITELSRSWAEEIEKTYRPDCVVYVAKAGFLIGRELANYFEIPLVAVSASRSGDNAKRLLSGAGPLIPERIKDAARLLELKTKIHRFNSERNIMWPDGDSGVKSAGKILIVDDSADTGNTIAAVKNAVHQSAPHANIRLAALNVWGESKNNIIVDYSLFSDTILKTPMSKDNREHKQFLLEYERACKNEGE